MAAEARQCVKCLSYTHFTKNCKKADGCAVKGCNADHHLLLHPAIEGTASSLTVKRSSAIARCNKLQASYVNVSRLLECPVLLMSLPVRLSNGSRVYDTFALLDAGSEITMITAKAADKLKLTGPKESLEIQWWQGDKKRVESTVVDFRADDVDGYSGLDLEQVYAVPEMEVADQEYERIDVEKRWPYLRGLGIPSVDASKIDVLIGLDQVKAHIQLSVKKPPRSTVGPTAFLTKLGWCLGGRTKKRVKNEQPSARRVSFIRAHGTEDESLADCLERFWNTVNGNSVGHFPSAT